MNSLVLLRVRESSFQVSRWVTPGLALHPERSGVMERWVWIYELNELCTCPVFLVVDSLKFCREPRSITRLKIESKIFAFCQGRATAGLKQSLHRRR
jgi:hypothetical protein